MTILEFLKEPGTRVSCGWRWLVRNDDTFTVYEQRYGQRLPRRLVETEDEDEAVRVLKGDG